MTDTRTEWEIKKARLESARFIDYPREFCFKLSAYYTLSLIFSACISYEALMSSSLQDIDRIIAEMNMQLSIYVDKIDHLVQDE